MSTFPNSPRLLKGGIVLVDPESSSVQRIIPLHYNPDSLSRTLQVKGTGADGGDRSDALRLGGGRAIKNGGINSIRLISTDQSALS